MKTHSLTVSRIAKTAGNIVLQRGGVVRGFTNWGVFALPKPMRDTSSGATATTQNQTSSQSAPDDASISPSSTSLASRQHLLHRKYYTGHYFIMRFDSDGRTQHMVRRTMSLDPRLLRYSVVKMGHRLEEISDVGGRAEEWTDVPGAEGARWSTVG